MDIVIPQNESLWGTRFSGLHYCLESISDSGNVPVVMDAWDCPLVNEFRKIYRHNSPNPRWFECWCFETWILLAEWMKKNSKRVVMKTDSDTLFFDDMEKFWEKSGNPVCNHPSSTSFVTVEIAQRIVDFLFESFRCDLSVEVCSPNHVCDMYMLKRWMKNRNGYLDLADPCRPEIIDTNLFESFDGLKFEDHKDIQFVKLKAAWVRPTTVTQMLTIHCWGRAKTLMGKIYDQAKQSRNGDVVRLCLD